MTATKSFPTLHVLSVVTGRLMGDIGGVYEVLGFMSGGPVWTHQLPRISKEARPVMVERQPDLAQAIDEAEQVTSENWQEWARTWLDRYGPELTVPRMTADQHKTIGPVEELADMMPGKEVIVVATDAQAAVAKAERGQ